MTGLAICVIGMMLYALAEKVAAFGYLLLPLPPIAVAAYINWLVDNAVSLLRGAALHTRLRKVLMQTLVGGFMIVVITFLILAGLIIWHAWTSAPG